MKRFTKGCLIPRKVATIFCLFLLLGPACQNLDRSSTPGANASEKINTPSTEAWLAALMSGHSDIIEAGIAAKLDPNSTNQHGDTALMWAAYRGRADWVAAMIKNKGNPAHAGSYGKTALHLAAERNHPQVIKILLSANAPIDKTDRNGRTPLEEAIVKDSRKAVTALLDYGVNPQADDNRPLMAAIKARDNELVAQLVLAGADPLHQSESYQKTPLQYALLRGSENLFTQQAIAQKYPDISRTIKDTYKSEVVNLAAKPELDFQKMALEIHKRVNQIRKENQLGQLTYDQDLAKIATAHSKDMATRKFFDHVNPDDKTPTDRAREAGYPIRKSYKSFHWKEGIAENIFKTQIYAKSTVEIRNGTQFITHEWRTEQDLVEAAVEGWMDSPGHRANILTREAEKHGIGIAVDEADGIYVTQNLF